MTARNLARRHRRVARRPAAQAPPYNPLAWAMVYLVTGAPGDRPAR